MAGRFRPFEWLWLGSEASRAREEPLASPSVRELIRRAELAIEIAERVQRPTERFEQGRGDAVACELYRQSIHWSLAAKGSLGAGDSESLERARAELGGKGFHDYAELEPKQQAESAARLESLAKSLLVPLRAVRDRFERIWIQRVLRIGALLFVLASIAMAVRSAYFSGERRRDLARDAAWTTSSRYEVGGCQSPEQVCREGASYFFHTYSEIGPWLLFDLGSDRRMSGIWVENRRDCCAERGVPLVVEVSRDQQTWQEVARRQTVFSTWQADFPRVRARFVRLRVPRESILHLAAVRILR